MVTGSRDTTTVATQALYLLNDPFVRRQSLALAERLLGAIRRDDAERVEPRLSPDARPTRPTSHEIERALRYLADYELRHAATAAPPRQVVDATITQSAAAGGADATSR